MTVYYFIWTAVLGAGVKTGVTVAGYNLAQMLTYVSVGWIIRSFYWNTIDQEMAYEVLEGKIAMELIKPVSVQGMWLARADRRIGVSPDPADRADGHRHRADLSGAASRVGGTFCAVSVGGAG